MRSRRDGLRRWMPFNAGVALRAALAAVVVGVCAGIPAGASAQKSSAHDAAGGVSSLPASTRSLYTNLTSDTPVAASPLISFKAKSKPPWTIGYSSEYTGNNWRAAAITRLNQLEGPYKKAGLIKKVIIEQSNLNNSLQIEQIKQMVNEGVSAIITCCSATTVLNSAIAYAHQHGVPFFVFNGYVTSPYAISEEGNYYQDGEEMGSALFKAMHGKGAFLNVIGFPGIASNDSVEAGMQAAMKKFPHITEAGSVTSQDTDAQAKEQVLQFLGSHPGKVSGVFTQSPGETGVLQAFQQSGRQIPPITVGGETGPECYWKKHPSWVQDGYNVWPPGDDFQAIWEIAIRTLEGQGPKIQTMIHATGPFTQASAISAVPKSCSTSGDAFSQPSMSSYFSTSFMNGFFEHPANPLQYKR